ncbi:hypothetical protein ANN_10899 [Periplaneta americana]|uniref:Uncharacterized protein n=1 Tax=Periplaneta americana TaxID=6978 RepID=A0ABQ8T4S5_PERAM|nr:hypothetical protein ANN_10899 [Periplaneta americana]
MRTRKPTTRRRGENISHRVLNKEQISIAIFCHRYFASSVTGLSVTKYRFVKYRPSLTMYACAEVTYSLISRIRYIIYDVTTRFSMFLTALVDAEIHGKSDRLHHNSDITIATSQTSICEMADNVRLTVEHKPRRASVHTPDNFEAVRMALTRSHSKSTRRTSAELRIGRWTVQRIMRSDLQ